MSEDVILDINRAARQLFELNVYSTHDVQKYEDMCQAQVAAQAGQMEARMEHGEQTLQYTQAQLRFVQEELQAQSSRLIHFCRSEHEGVIQEALQQTPTSLGLRSRGTSSDVKRRAG